MPRICIINEYFYPDDTGGTGAVLSSLARSLQDDHGDLKIDVLTSRHLYRGASETLSADEDWDGITIHRLSGPKPNGLPMPLRLIANLLFSLAVLGRLLRHRHYDLLVIGTAPPTLALTAHLYQRLTATPFLYIIYDLEPDRMIALGSLAPEGVTARMIRHCQGVWLHAAHTVVVLGRCMEQHLAHRYGLEQSTVIPIGADPEAIVPGSKQTCFRERHGLTGLVVCYSGNFGRYHNFDAILDAARDLKNRRTADVTFVLVGGGAQKGHIARRMAEESLTNVLLLPFVPNDEYADLLASADVSLVTLEPGMEGICVPSKFYSILASGRPTIALVSPGSEVAMVVREWDCGIQIDQGDSGALVKSICRLTEAPQELERMGRNARRALVERYSSTAVAEQYHSAINRAVGSRTGSGDFSPAPQIKALH